MILLKQIHDLDTKNRLKRHLATPPKPTKMMEDKEK